jgi:hypothetical protein
MHAVVDTNVAVVANNKNREPILCSSACARALNNIMKHGTLVIDEGSVVLSEYRNHLSFAGQPGAGDVFFKWLIDNMYCHHHISRVPLEPHPQHAGEFLAFPNTPDLSAFDYSDRKFVALALSHPSSPVILNAVDSDWWIHLPALRANGLVVEFVCGEDHFLGKPQLPYSSNSP